ncbi:MAG: efflux RND transporter permease subunit [Pseudolabrys sp.]
MDYINSTVGVGGPNSTNNTGRIFIGLKPKSERGDAGVVIDRLRKSVGSVIGMQTYFRAIQNINLGGRISKGEYQYTLQSSDTDVLYAASEEMRLKIAKLDFCAT